VPKKTAKKRVKSTLVPSERIEQSILLLRGQKVMLDSDLSALYGVETKVLVRAVKRNLDRFPEDWNNWRKNMTKTSASFLTQSDNSCSHLRGNQSERSVFINWKE